MAKLQVTVAYASPDVQFLQTVSLPEGAAVQDALDASGVCKQFTTINWQTHAVGILSRVVSLDTVLSAGDRVEIYRPLTFDPMTIRRKRAEKKDR